MILFCKLKSGLLILLLFLIAFSSCSESNEKKQIVKKLMESELVLPSLISESETEYTVFRYVKPKSCTSCQLQMGKWRIYKRRLEKKYGDRVSLFFLIDTSDPDESRKLLEIYKFKNNCIIDSTHNFVKENPMIEQFEDELIMLIDRNDKIILIGNPFENTKIDSLYQQIID